MSAATDRDWRPSRGDEVYDEHGQAGHYVAPAKGGGHIVQAIIESDGDGYSEPGGAYVGEPMRWHEIFRKPPVAKLEGRIAELEAERDKIVAEVRSARQAKQDLEAEQRAMKERLALHEQLTWIDDLLLGRFTHYLVRESDYGDNWLVMTAQDFREKRHLSQVRLQLFVSTHDRTNSFQWRVIQGSPGDRFDDKSKGVIPFKSEAEAIAKRNEFLLETMRQRAAGHANAGSHGLDEVVRRAINCGVEIPEDIAENLRERKAREAQMELDKAQAALAAAFARAEALK